MTLQIISPEWLASPEGQEWVKERQEAWDKAFSDTLNKVEVPLKDVIDNINH